MAYTEGKEQQAGGTGSETKIAGKRPKELQEKIEKQYAAAMERYLTKVANADDEKEKEKDKSAA